MKQMQKEKYEAPLTDRCLVALESGICAGSGDFTNSDSENGRIDEHQVNTDFGTGAGGAVDFGSDSWDATGTAGY